MKKVVLLVFNGDPLCFIHVLLNALDMKDKGYDARIVMEGAATRLIPELALEQNPLHILWEKARNNQIIKGVCRACSHKMGVLKAAEAQELKFWMTWRGIRAWPYTWRKALKLLPSKSL